MPKLADFDAVLREAVADITENGADEEGLLEWLRRLKQAAYDSLLPSGMMRQKLAAAYRAIYDKLINQGGALKKHIGAERFMLEQMRPELHAELDRRIHSSAELIKLNRDEEIEKTLRRFAGWASSIPRGGSRTTDRREEVEKIRKSLAGLSFRERRVLIDQGQKLTSAIHDIIATDGGAIAAKWVSHWNQHNYDYREDHKDRMQESNKLPFVVRDNWALKAGLMRLAGSKYTDDMTQPGEEVYCQCYYDYIYQLSALPDVMLTAKGREAIRSARADSLSRSDALIKVNGRERFYNRVESVTQVGAGKWRVVAGHGTYIVTGGRGSGGASNEWYFEGPHYNGAVNATSLADAIKMIDNT